MPKMPQTNNGFDEAFRIPEGTKQFHHLSCVSAMLKQYNTRGELCSQVECHLLCGMKRKPVAVSGFSTAPTQLTSMKTVADLFSVVNAMG